MFHYLDYYIYIIEKGTFHFSYHTFHTWARTDPEGGVDDPGDGGYRYFWGRMEGVFTKKV